MEMSFFAMPSHRSEQWAFQNGVFPNKAMASKGFILHTPF
jgi:hypothetical protein